MEKGIRRYDAIVVGTSAGGFNALSVIFENIPADYPIPVIVVQHRAKDSQDLFEEVFQRKCKITVKQTDEKEKIMPGRIYVAPPDYHLLVESDKTFSLSSDALVHFSRPSIDVLFESAALAFRERLVGIILTGANNDGANGIVTIRKLGGMTIAQDPREAKYAMMPQSSIGTNHVQFVWQLSEIREFIHGIALPSQ